MAMFSIARTVTIALSLLTTSLALAQTGDYFILLSGEKRVGNITRADAQNLYWQSGQNELPQPWRTIKDWHLVERPAVKQALAAVNAGQHAQAVQVLKSVADAYVVLPTVKVPWVTDAVIGLIRAYTELKQYAEADGISKKFAMYHPAEVNLVKAYLAVAMSGQGKYDEAITILQEVTKAGDAKLAVSPAEGRTLGQAYLSLGDCYNGKGDLKMAFDCYLKTVVLYYHDESVTRQAQAKADELKKKLNPPEGKNQGS